MGFHLAMGTLIYQRRRGLKIVNASQRPKRIARVGKSQWCSEGSMWLRWIHFGTMSAMVESDVIVINSEKFREITMSNGSVFSMSQKYAEDFLRNSCDSSGYAWDISLDLLYSQSPENTINSWWQNEVIHAEEQV